MMINAQSKWFRTAFLAVTILHLVPAGALACATCMGSPEDPLTQGLNAGILSLLAIVFLVLSGAAAFFIYIARRAAAFDRQQSANS